MPTPSLLIVPARFKSGKLYSQIPTNGAGDFTVTRATAATRVNASGFIESVASGIPRLDYFASDGTVGCPALLVEPSGTNTWLYSEPASATGYTAENVSFVTENLAGTVSAVLLQDSTVNRSLQQSIGNKQGQTWTMFFYVKVGAGVLPNQTGGTYRDFTLTIDNVDVNNAGFTYRDVGNGVYQVRHSRTFTSTSSIAVIRKYGSTNNNVPVVFSRIEFYSGDVPFGVSYIPTTTGSVTRNADVVSVSGAVSGSIGQTEGTMYAEVDLRTLPSVGIILSINTGNAADRIEIYITSNGKVNFDRVATTESGATSLASNSTYSVNSILKIAIGYKSGDTIMYINGIAETSQQTTTFTFATIFRVNIGSGRLSTSSFNNRIRAVALYNTRLTNAELAALTA